MRSRTSASVRAKKAKCTLKVSSSQADGPDWEDDTFNVHFAFFARTEADVRLRILEGRRSRLEERLDAFRSAAAQRRERLDLYTAELQRHGLDSVEREVR